MSWSFGKQWAFYEFRTNRFIATWTSQFLGQKWRRLAGWKVQVHFSKHFLVDQLDFLSDEIITTRSFCKLNYTIHTPTNTDITGKHIIFDRGAYICKYFGLIGGCQVLMMESGGKSIFLQRGKTMGFSSRKSCEVLTIVGTTTLGLSSQMPRLGWVLPPLSVSWSGKNHSTQLLVEGFATISLAHLRSKIPSKPLWV